MTSRLDTLLTFVLGMIVIILDVGMIAFVFVSCLLDRLRCKWAAKKAKADA